MIQGEGLWGNPCQWFISLGVRTGKLTPQFLTQFRKTSHQNDTEISHADLFFLYVFDRSVTFLSLQQCSVQEGARHKKGLGPSLGVHKKTLLMINRKLIFIMASTAFSLLIRVSGQPSFCVSLCVCSFCICNMQAVYTTI